MRESGDLRDIRALLSLIVIVAAQFIVMLDSSILNVALPSIADDLGLTSVGSAWVLNAYFLTFGGFLLVSGRAADVFGRRRMFLAGTAILTVASVIGGFADSELVLVAARLLQGVGAAMLSPAAMSIILLRFSGPSRATAMSMWGAASAVGGAAGVSVGGLITASLGWPWVFHLTAATAIGAGLAAWRLLPADGARTPRRFDAFGAITVTLAALAAVYAVLSLPQDGPWSLPVLGGAAVAVALVALFVRLERRAADPILPLGVFRDIRVSAGVAINVLGGAARVGCFFMVAMLLQEAFAYGADVAGLAMLPTSVAGFLISTLALPRLLNRFGPELVAVAGLVLLVAAHAVLAAAPGRPDYLLHVLPALLLAAAGVAMSFTPTTLVIAKGIAAQNSGVGSGLASSSAQLGGALGIAAFSAVDVAVRAQVVTDASATAAAAAQAGLSAAFTAAAVTAAAAALIGAAALLTARTRRRTDARAAEVRPAVPTR